MAAVVDERMNALGTDLDAAQGEVDSLRLPPGARAPGVSARARAALEAAVDALPSIDTLTETIRARLLDSWPEFADTVELERELRDTIDSNLRRFFGEVIISDTNETLVAPPQALSFAISVQHHGIDTAILIQAYRVGQNVAWSWWMEHLARELSDRTLLMEVIGRSSHRMFAYVDAVVAEQVRLWQRQRERWSGHLIMQRAEAVRRLLEGDAPALERSAREIGYSLERELVAGVLWESPPAALRDLPAPTSRLELAAEAVVDAVGSARALVVPAGPACIWAWFVVDRAFGLDALERSVVGHLRDGQGLALSIPGRGLEGFRGGHRQALRARRFADLSQGPRGVVRFDEVETLCVMSEDPQLLADFVERKLGPLAAASSSARRLRETLLVWLREGGSASRAAERLCTHKNTVRNRVQRAEQILGRPVEDDRLGLELALTVLQRVGSREEGEPV
jgi:DNA-binding PucR family transcriptional regulator